MSFCAVERGPSQDVPRLGSLRVQSPQQLASAGRSGEQGLIELTWRLPGLLSVFCVVVTVAPCWALMCCKTNTLTA